jgi:hypothetical protein
MLQVVRMVRVVQVVVQMVVQVVVQMVVQVVVHLTDTSTSNNEPLVDPV